MMSGYEVYKCRLDGNVIYVGQGKTNRHKHCNSGCSHVYELNKMHFQGIVFDVAVKRVKTKYDAILLENHYIQKYKPKYNTVGIADNRQEVANVRAAFKKALTDDIKYTRLPLSQKNKMYKIIDEFIKYHTHNDLTENGLRLRGHGVYKSSGFKVLATCVNNMKVGRGMDSTNTTPYQLHRILNDHFNKFYDHPINQIIHITERNVRLPHTEIIESNDRSL